MIPLQFLNQLSKEMTIVISSVFLTIFLYGILIYFVVGASMLIINILEIFLSKHDDNIREDDNK